LFVFEIFADGHKIGITVARTPALALEKAYGATTRRTESKIDISCDFNRLVARKLNGTPTPMGAVIPPSPVKTG
jgi:hypothetical protein